MLTGSFVHQFLAVTLMASVGIVLLKWLAVQSRVSGLQKFAGAI